nr:thioredoxin-like domain-containing protein [uncultured Carboxylicivirga sp.]
MKLQSFAFFILVAINTIGQNRIIENPHYRTKTSHLNDIYKVEITDTSTNVYFEVTFTPGRFIVISDRSYIQDTRTEKKLFMKSYSGIPVGLNAKWKMPESGKVNYMMSYPRVDNSVASIDFMDEGGGGGSWHIFGIQIADKKDYKFIPEQYMGNWLRTDGSNEWIVGFYEDVVIYQNDFWQYESITPKKKKLEVIITKNNKRETLVLSSIKDDILSLSAIDQPRIECSKNARYNSEFKYPADTLTPYTISQDTAIVRGYISKYYSDEILDLENGICFYNGITGVEEKYPFTIDKTGYYEAKIPLSHPNYVFINIKNFGRRVYIEPGTANLFYHEYNGESYENKNFMGDNEAINLAEKEVPGIKNANNIESYLPLWLKVKRKNNIFTSFYSTDGKVWKEIYKNDTLSMSDQAFAGVFVKSGDNSELCKATFSHVTLNGKSVKDTRWINTDIGNISLNGKSTFENNQILIEGSGEKLRDTADSFYFLNIPIDGDAEITACVNSFSNSNHHPEIGVMIREDTSPEAKYVEAGAYTFGIHKDVRQQTEGETYHRGRSKRYNAYDDFTFSQYTEKLNDNYSLYLKELESFKHSSNTPSKLMQIAINDGKLYNAYFLTQYYFKKPEVVFNNNTEYHQFETNYIDTETLEEINKVINNPISIYCHAYAMTLNQCITYANSLTKASINKNWSYLFKQMEETGIVFSQDEQNKKEAIIAYEQQETKEPLISTKEKQIEDYCKYFNTAYADIISWAHATYTASISIESMNSVFGPTTPLTDDIIKISTLSLAHTEKKTVWSETLFEKTLNSLTNKQVISPLVNQNNRLQKKIEEIKNKHNFTEGESLSSLSKQLFNSMIEKYNGKVVFVDFWATWCRPCHDGIKRMMPLKDEMQNEDVVFLYITNETSPLSTYESTIPDIKGEHYRITTEEWNILTSKFNITGIPHYLLVDKEGKVVNNSMPFDINNNQLKTLLEEQLEKTN